ncbi:MAG: hypothetical protein D8M52_06420 [Chlorobi bacterium]|nr:MAG: hypothetical protein UZ06_CHB003001452 [Chlorobi bacterium OLB6]MBL1161337.1 hypothetical protein [Chlorobiota bacterium]MBV6462727.1 hypothetical protein [Chlorobiota bacterium]
MKKYVACLCFLVVTATVLVAQENRKETENLQLYYYSDPCKGICPGGTWSSTEYELTLRISPIGPGYPVPTNAPEEEACTTTVKYRIIDCSGENQNPKRTVIQFTAVCTTCPGDVTKAIKNAVLRLLAKDNPGGLLRTTDGAQSISFSLPGCWSAYTCSEGWTTNRKYCALPCANPSPYMSNTRTSCCVYTFEVARANCDYSVSIIRQADHNPTSYTCDNNVKPSIPDCMAPPEEYDLDGTIGNCKSRCFQISDADIAGINAEYEVNP